MYYNKDNGPTQLDNGSYKSRKINETTTMVFGIVSVVLFAVPLLLTIIVAIVDYPNYDMGIAFLYWCITPVLLAANVAGIVLAALALKWSGSYKKEMKDIDVASRIYHRRVKSGKVCGIIGLVGCIIASLCIILFFDYSCNACATNACGGTRGNYFQRQAKEIETEKLKESYQQQCKEYYEKKYGIPLEIEEGKFGEYSSVIGTVSKNYSRFTVKTADGFEIRYDDDDKLFTDNREGATVALALDAELKSILGNDFRELSNCLSLNQLPNQSFYHNKYNNEPVGQFLAKEDDLTLSLDLCAVSDMGNVVSDAERISQALVAAYPNSRIEVELVTADVIKLPGLTYSDMKQGHLASIVIEDGTYEITYYYSIDVDGFKITANRELQQGDITFEPVQISNEELADSWNSRIEGKIGRPQCTFNQQGQVYRIHISDRIKKDEGYASLSISKGDPEADLVIISSDNVSGYDGATVKLTGDGNEYVFLGSLRRSYNR